MICTDCGIDFNKKRSKKGKINQCDDCSQEDKTVRSIGYNDGSLNKAQSIAVYKGADERIRKQLLGHRMV
jgi:hypothetical protein